MSISPDIAPVLKLLAKRDGMPRATKAAQLIRVAIDIEEDQVLAELAMARDVKSAKFISHIEAWK